MQKIWRKINTLLSKIFTRKITLAAIFLIVFLGVFGLVSPARAELGQWLASGLLLPLAALLGKVLLAIIEILIGIVQYNDFVNNPAVQTGWTIVRDICNMFFILVLLVIAFGTIFKIETYRYNRLLGRLIMMAVLINFSKMIAGFFIDISQVVMLTFVNGFRDTAAGNFTEAFALREMLGFTTGAAPQGWEALGIGLLAIVMTLIAMVVMIVMVVVFLMRIIMLWILVVLSPLAYLLYAFPGKAQQYSSQWWNSFGKYAATGPVLAFFIWLGLAVLTGFGEPGKNVSNEILKVTVPEGEQGTFVEADANEELMVVPSRVGSPTGILNFIISIAMFVGALMVAQQMGGVAGNFAGSAMGKLRGVGMGAVKLGAGAALLPAKGAWELTKSGGRKVRRGVRDFVSEKAPWANVPAVFRGAKQRGAELEKYSKEYAEAGGREMWERATTGGKLRIPHRERVASAYEAAKARDYAHMTKEEIAERADGILSMGNSPSARREKRSFFRTAAEKGFPDDIMEKFIDKILGHLRAKGQKEYELNLKDGMNETDAAENAESWKMIGGKDGENWYGAAQLDEFMAEYLGDDAEMNRFRGEMVEIWKRTRHGEYAGLTDWDKEKGEKGRPKGSKRVMEKTITEVLKETERSLRGAAPQSFVNFRRGFVPELDEEKNIIYLDENGEPTKEKTGRIKMTKTNAKGGRMDMSNEEVWKKAGSNAEKRNATEHFQGRTPNYMMGGTGDYTNVDNEGWIIGDQEDLDRIRKMRKEAPNATAAFYRGVGGTSDKLRDMKFIQVDDKGNVVNKLEGANMWDVKPEEYEEMLVKDEKPRQPVKKGKKGEVEPEVVGEGEEGEGEEGEVPVKPSIAPSGGASAAAGDIEDILRKVNKDEAGYTPDIRYQARTKDGLRQYKSLEELYRDEKILRDDEGNPEDIEVYDGIKKLDAKSIPVGGEIWNRFEVALDKLKEGKPQALADIDKSKIVVTQAKVDEYQKKYQGDFFISKEYLEGMDKGQYVDQKTLEESKELEEYKAKYGTEGIRGMAAYGVGSRDTIGIDFDKFEVEGVDLKGKAGAYITDPETLGKIKPKLQGMIDDEINKIQQKHPIEKTDADRARLKDLEDAKARMDNPEEFKKLKLANIGRTGYNMRHVLAHEGMHDQLESADANQELQKQLWQEFSAEEKSTVTEQVKRKMNNAQMAEAEVMKEYFAEGLANAGKSTWADQTPDAIKLKPEALSKLKKKIDVSEPLTADFEAPSKISRLGLTFSRISKKIEKPFVALGKKFADRAKLKEEQKTLQERKDKQNKLAGESNKTEKDAEFAQANSYEKTEEYKARKKEREELEKDQYERQRIYNKEAADLSKNMKEEKNLMDNTTGAESQQHRKNYNKMAEQMSNMKKNFELGQKKVEEARKKEEKARQEAEKATAESKAKTTTSDDKQKEVEEALTGRTPKEILEESKNDVVNLGKANHVKYTDVGNAVTAIYKKDYETAFSELQRIRGQIANKPNIYAEEIASLNDKIANAENSLKLGVPTQMANQIQTDINNWQNQMNKLREAIGERVIGLREVDKIINNLTKIPEAKSAYEKVKKQPEAPPKVEAKPEDKIKDLTEQHESPETSPEQKKEIDQKVTEELEKVSPPDEVFENPEVQTSVTKIKEMLDQFETVGVDLAKVKDQFANIGVELGKVNDGLKAVSGSEKFIKHIEKPTEQARLGSIGQLTNEEAHNFNYNIKKLYEFFRDKWKAQPESGKSGSQKSSPSAGHSKPISTPPPTYSEPTSSSSFTAE